MVTRRSFCRSRGCRRARLERHRGRPPQLDFGGIGRRRPSRRRHLHPFPRPFRRSCRCRDCREPPVRVAPGARRRKPIDAGGEPCEADRGQRGNFVFRRRLRRRGGVHVRSVVFLPARSSAIEAARHGTVNDFATNGWPAILGLYRSRRVEAVALAGACRGAPGSIPLLEAHVEVESNALPLAGGLVATATEACRGRCCEETTRRPGVPNKIAGGYVLRDANGSPTYTAGRTKPRQCRRRGLTEEVCGRLFLF
jgi:hypothetical protein